MPGWNTVRYTGDKKKKSHYFKCYRYTSTLHPVYFPDIFCMVSACKHVISPSLWFTGDDKQVSAFLTITQTLMLFMLRDMHLVTCASEPVIAHSTHLLTAFCYNHSLLGVFWISTKHDNDHIPKYPCKYIKKNKWKRVNKRLTWNSLYKGCRLWHKWWWRGLTQ